MTSLAHIQTQKTMSSREIAELTGKKHRNVLADIRAMLRGLGLEPADFSADLFDAYGRPQPGFMLPKRETLILVSGYSVAMRARIIDRWQELEAAQAPAIPSTLSQALRLAADQAEQLDLLDAMYDRHDSQSNVVVCRVIQTQQLFD
jgi:phage regulator Rha-like protein